jgi:hypothetical protein
VADRVEVEPRPRDLGRVQVGGQHDLRPEHRPGQHLPERAHDAAPAPDQHSLRVVPGPRGVVGRAVRPGQVLAGRQDEAAAFEGDVPHRRQPGVAVVDGDRAVPLHALRVHRRLHQGHVVLPAVHRPGPPGRGVDHREGRAVPLAPDEPLQGRRHQLAVLAQERPVRAEVQGGAVQGRAGPLDRPDDQVDAVPPATAPIAAVAGPGTSTAASKYRRNSSRPSGVREPMRAPNPSPFG